jgi:hypothetical protein
MTTKRSQVALLACEIARRIVQLHGVVAAPDNPDTCIILPTSNTGRVSFDVSGTRWNVQRALLMAGENTVVRSLCKNKLCIRVDHLRMTKRRPWKRQWLPDPDPSVSEAHAPCAIVTTAKKNHDPTKRPKWHECRRLHPGFSHSLAPRRNLTRGFLVKHGEWVLSEGGE